MRCPFRSLESDHVGPEVGNLSLGNGKMLKIIEQADSLILFTEGTLSAETTGPFRGNLSPCPSEEYFHHLEKIP